MPVCLPEHFIYIVYVNSRTNDSNQQALNSRAIANNVSSKHSNSGYLPFEDNRQVAIHQRKLIEIVNSKKNNTVTQLTKGVSNNKKWGGSKGNAGQVINAGKKNPAYPKRPRFLGHVKKARKFANAMNKHKGFKIHMAHRMSWEKIAKILSASKGDHNNGKFRLMLRLVTVPNRRYGKIPKNSKVLHDKILEIAKKSNQGTNDPQVASELNSSIINLRPGNGNINSSIQGKNDYNYNDKKQGKKNVRARSPISERLHQHFPDKNPTTKSSSFLSDQQAGNWENNVNQA